MYLSIHLYDTKIKPFQRQFIFYLQYIPFYVKNKTLMKGLNMKLMVEYLENYDKSWGNLVYKHADDSGFDMRAAIKEPITLKAGTYALIPNGVKLKIESDDNAYEIQLRARSGLAARNGIGLVNGIGTFDYGFRGEYITILSNWGQTDFVINPGDRICQAVVCPIIRPEIVEIDTIETNDTTRGINGLGSTGKN